MERGAKTLLYILIGSLVIGALVVASVPVYRRTALAIWHGEPAQSPIWRSNQAYYTEVQLGSGEADVQRE